VYELSSGSTAAMSRIGAAGVSRVMNHPGGMIAPWVSSALSRRLTVCPRRMTPSRAATTVTRATAAICASRGPAHRRPHRVPGHRVPCHRPLGLGRVGRGVRANGHQAVFHVACDQPDVDG